MPTRTVIFMGKIKYHGNCKIAGLAKMIRLDEMAIRPNECCLRSNDDTDELVKLSQIATNPLKRCTDKTINSGVTSFLQQGTLFANLPLALRFCHGPPVMYRRVCSNAPPRPHPGYATGNQPSFLQ